jgi:hypothetical protein
MKKIACVAFLLGILHISSFAQPDYSHYYIVYSSIKKYDLSALWDSDSILTDTREKVSFPEPLGYIGVNFQRFDIHYLSIVKSKRNPYVYDVTGKTRVNNNICTFRGSITILKAILYRQINFPPDREGTVECAVHLYEDSAQAGSGSIEGRLVTDFYLDKNDQIYYSTLEDNADSYCNNQCTARWKSYRTGAIKKCNWGDYRIPESKGLDIGAGVFRVDEKYIQFGWDSYMKAFGTSSPESQKALAREETRWWEK